MQQLREAVKPVMYVKIEECIAKKETKLNLYICNINQQGCSALAQALETNTSLQQLDLYNNPISDSAKQAVSADTRIKF